MRKIVLSTLLLVTVVFFMSCAHGISPFEAANGKAKCRKTYNR